MEEQNNNSHPQVRYWTFEEWQEAGEIHRFFDCSKGFNGIDKDSGKRNVYRMTPVELNKLENYLQAEYWNDVTDYFESKKGRIMQTWFEAIPDPMLISREIEIAEYHLYPEKFIDKPEPYGISVLYKDEKEEIPHIRKAYAEILRYGRTTWDLAGERENYRTANADGMKKYLDWLVSFQNYLQSHEPTRQAILDFDDTYHLGPEKPYDTHTPDSNQKRLTLKQAALLLKYKGTTVTNPLCVGSQTNTIAKELCGLTSASSGRRLFEMMDEINNQFGHEYHRKLIDEFSSRIKMKRVLTNRLKDLQSVGEFLGHGEVYERVSKEYKYLRSEFDSIK